MSHVCTWDAMFLSKQLLMIETTKEILLFQLLTYRKFSQVQT
jgi:hypothetical protein